MITYDFVSVSLDSLDTLQAEVIVLPFFSDERPLRGAAGLLDWRLCGALSRKLLAGYLDGQFGDKALIAEPQKIKADALLLVGLGLSHEFDPDAAKRASELIAAALNRAKLSTAALVLPGRSMDLIGSLDAMELWLAASSGHNSIEEIIVIERAEEHRVLESLFDGLRRQAESPLA